MSDNVIAFLEQEVARLEKENGDLSRTADKYKLLAAESDKKITNLRKQNTILLKAMNNYRRLTRKAYDCISRMNCDMGEVIKRIFKEE